MIVKNIPEWQYPLYKTSDKNAYAILEKLGKSKRYLKLVGSHEEIDCFIQLAILSQKMKDYRKFRDITLREFKKKEINTSKMIEAGESLKIPRGIDASWVVLKQDRRLCELIDRFRDADVRFVGNNQDVSEFFVRFWLTQLLQDWRGPLMAVLLACLHDKHVKVKKLNILLKAWDYTKVF